MWAFVEAANALQNYATLLFLLFCDFLRLSFVAFGFGLRVSSLGRCCFPLRFARVRGFEGRLSQSLRRFSLMISYGPGGVVSRGGLHVVSPHIPGCFDSMYPL